MVIGFRLGIVIEVIGRANDELALNAASQGDIRIEDLLLVGRIDMRRIDVIDPEYGKLVLGGLAILEDISITQFGRIKGIFRGPVENVIAGADLRLWHVSTAGVQSKWADDPGYKEVEIHP